MKTVFLEFERELPNGERRLAALGTDVIFYRDGRWSADTFVCKMKERAAEIMARREGDPLTFVGYTPSHGGYVSAPKLVRVH